MNPSIKPWYLFYSRTSTLNPTSFFFKFLWVFIAVGGLSLVALSGGYSLVVVCGFLVVVASLGCGAWAVEPMGFSSCALQALECRLSSCGAWAQLPCSMWDLSSWTRVWIHIPISPYLGHQGSPISSCWTTREVPSLHLRINPDGLSQRRPRTGWQFSSAKFLLRKWGKEMNKVKTLPPGHLLPSAIPPSRHHC